MSEVLYPDLDADDLERAIKLLEYARAGVARGLSFDSEDLAKWIPDPAARMALDMVIGYLGPMLDDLDRSLAVLQTAVRAASDGE